MTAGMAEVSRSRVAYWDTLYHGSSKLCLHLSAQTERAVCVVENFDVHLCLDEFDYVTSRTGDDAEDGKGWTKNGRDSLR